MYSISICEENENVRGTLEKIISCYFVAKGFKADIISFSNPEDLLKHPEYTDLVFLDMDGNRNLSYQVARELKVKNPDMYLYIVSDKITHLDDAMDLKAFRYLSKSLDIHRIIASLDMIVSFDKRVSFMSNYTMTKLKESEIACIFSKERRTIVVTGSGMFYPTTLSIKYWVEKLSESRHFLHPHYSYIVNKNCIYDFDGKVITLRFKGDHTMKVYPSQRMMSQVKSVLKAGSFGSLQY